MSWWLWMLVGIALLAGEILTPGGFYIIFFGASAVVVGFLKLAGMGQGLAVEGLIFVGVAVAGVAFFRKPLMEKFGLQVQGGKVDDLASEIACAMDDIAPGAIGKVEMRGTSWNAANDGDETIPKAGRCRITRVDGLTLHVRSL